MLRFHSNHDEYSSLMEIKIILANKPFFSPSLRINMWKKQKWFNESFERPFFLVNFIVLFKINMSNSPNGSNHSSSGRENPTGFTSSTMIKRRNSRESPMAFYEIPSWVENVPSKIINEAKQSLRDMPTSRPFTPRDDSRYSLAKINRDTSSFK